jgi:putative hydrolase of the HAD superfamily
VAASADWPCSVFFDVGNTLIFPSPSVAELCREVIEAAGHEAPPMGEIERLMPLADRFYEERYWEDDSFWTKEQRAASMWTDMYEVLFTALGFERPVSVELAHAVYHAFGSAARWQAYDDVKPGFKELKSRGIKVGLISNWDTRLADIFRDLGLTKYLDCIICSASVGLHKPDPRIFEVALSRVDCAPKDAVHCGDHYFSDIIGARSVGITPVLMNRFEVELPADCLVVSSVEELVVAIDEGHLEGVN